MCDNHITKCYATFSSDGQTVICPATPSKEMAIGAAVCAHQRGADCLVREVVFSLHTIRHQIIWTPRLGVCG